MLVYLFYHRSDKPLARLDTEKTVEPIGWLNHSSYSIIMFLFVSLLVDLLDLVLIQETISWIAEWLSFPYRRDY